MTIEIRRGRRGRLRRNQFYARIVFGNGKVFAHTEGYNNRAELFELCALIANGTGWTVADLT